MRAVSANLVLKCPVVFSRWLPTFPDATKQPSVKSEQDAVCALWLSSHTAFCFYSENEGEVDRMEDNKVTLAIPLRYEVALTVHG